MSISISEPMQITLDALYQGQNAPPDIVAKLTDAERAEIARLVRTANLARLSLNHPVPTAEMEAAALARVHQAIANKPPSSKPPMKTTPLPGNSLVPPPPPGAPAKPAPPPGAASPTAQPTKKQENDSDTGNWFTRLFKKP